jgi:hypothetical protein
VKAQRKAVKTEPQTVNKPERRYFERFDNFRQNPRSVPPSGQAAGLNGACQRFPLSFLILFVAQSAWPYCLPLRLRVFAVELAFPIAKNRYPRAYA